MKVLFSKSTLLLICCQAGLMLNAQTVKLLNSSSKASFRGLSVVTDKTVWVSGSGGTVGRSVDGGDSWKWMTVKGFEKTDFRDIEAFDDKTAVIMGIAAPAYILKTTDGGDSWHVVYENKDTSMFLDAMDFWDANRGVVIGDPINGKIFLAQTYDGGDNWRELQTNTFAVDSGEACFASSGTNIRKLNYISNVYVTGGKASHIFIHNEKRELPIVQGAETTGANSIAIKDSRTFIVVGGDFTKKDTVHKNCVITFDGGKTWTAPSVPPHGYRSCVEYLEKENWITCGLNGVDYSTNGGMTWTWISKEGFHAVQKAKKGKAVYFSGGGGRIGKLIN
jgi:photosystem II stability/assembly factor-like uncharacterized protein